MGRGGNKGEKHGPLILRSTPAPSLAQRREAERGFFRRREHSHSFRPAVRHAPWHALGMSVRNGGEEGPCSLLESGGGFAHARLTTQKVASSDLFPSSFPLPSSLLTYDVSVLWITTCLRCPVPASATISQRQSTCCKPARPMSKPHGQGTWARQRDCVLSPS